MYIYITIYRYIFIHIYTYIYILYICIEVYVCVYMYLHPYVNYVGGEPGEPLSAEEGMGQVMKVLALCAVLGSTCLGSHARTALEVPRALGFPYKGQRHTYTYICRYRYGYTCRCRHGYRFRCGCF